MDILECKEGYFIYSYKKALQKASYEDIVAIESDKPCIRILLKTNCFLVDGSLCNVKEHLMNYFIQINRQTIVNMKLAEKILNKKDEEWLLMNNGKMYKISERRVREVRGAFLLYG